MFTHRLFIGQKNYSSWSLRPWLLLKEMGINFDECPVVVAGKGHHSGLHFSYSPSGVVPVLHGPDGLQVWDSLAICEWAAEQPGCARAWPADARARAVARSLAAEMHSGFSAVRSTMSCNIKMARTTPLALDAATAAEVARIEAAWGGARREFGARAGGPYLFGGFTAADAMFAPVAFRFQTYGVTLRDSDAEEYCRALLANKFMREWEELALVEGDAIEHYDRHALERGAELRRPAPPAAPPAAAAE